MAVTSTIFTVKKSGRGRWAVCESGFEKPLAEFDERVDAIEYARGIAGTKPRASIDAEGDATSPAINETYALDPKTGTSTRMDA